MADNWQDDVKGYCDHYNIPLDYLVSTMYEPKVIPMIRGKAFEFSVMLGLISILSPKQWEVSHPVLNAQLGTHDIDVLVTHKASQKKIRIECKLAKKGSYRHFQDNHSEIRVKCMRSRTLGIEMINNLAPKMGVPKSLLKVHNDQYLPSDFDFVATSIGNAFYETNSNSGIFEWNPSGAGVKFLQKMAGTKENHKDFAFNRIYIARSSDIHVGARGVTCTRRKCSNKANCGFIPNYPIINFNKNSTTPSNYWHLIESCEQKFINFLK